MIAYKFQFQNGAIKRVQNGNVTTQLIEFQFQNGAIKSRIHSN